MFDHLAGQSWNGGGQPSQQRFGDPNELWSRTPSQESAAKIERMAIMLSKKLGPEYLTSRQGPGGGKLTYIEGWRVMNLANEVFGFNGWSTAVKDLSIDFIDYSEETQRWNAHVTAIVRITLPDGCYHEDVGCGKIDNCKSKADALDKIKKEAVTDATKRALRSFGNLLGNCLYDKRFLDDIAKVKAPAKPQFDFDDIHRPGRTYDSDGKPIAPGQVAAKPPVPGPSTVKPNVPPANAQNRALPSTNAAQPRQMQQIVPNNNAQLQAPHPAPQHPQLQQQQHPQHYAQNQQQQQPQQYRQNQQQQQQHGQPRPGQSIQSAHPPQAQQANKTFSVNPNRANIAGNTVNQQSAAVIPNLQIAHPPVQQYAPAHNERSKGDESEDYFDPEFDMDEASESAQPQLLAAVHEDSGFVEGVSGVMVKPEPQSKAGNQYLARSNNSHWPRLAVPPQAQQPTQAAVGTSSNGQLAPRQSTFGVQHPVTNGVQHSSAITTAQYQVGQRGPSTSSPEAQMRSAGQDANRSSLSRHVPQEVTTSTPSGTTKLQFRPSQGEAIVGFAPPPAGMALPESVAFTSARGMKRALPVDYDEEFAPAQLPQLQNLQPPQRAMSPTERAREAEQLQEKQRIIAQNRKAAIEKRQRLTNRQSGEKPVSI